MYIVRNDSATQAEIIITISKLKDSTAADNIEINSVDRVIGLTKSELGHSFKNKIVGMRRGKASRKFILPPGHSADISKLIGLLNPVNEATAGFYCSRIEILYGKRTLSLNNDLHKLKGIFKSKSFFWPGPLVYYIDLGQP